MYVENLQPATTYHYRLVAVNEDGTTYGPDQTFTTRGYPLSVVQTNPVGGRLGVTLPGESRESAHHHAKRTKKKARRKGGRRKR